MERNKNFIKFVIVGFGGLFTDLILFNLLSLKMLSATASLISGLVAMLFTFLMNNFWSFNERQKNSIKVLIPTFIIYSLSSYIPILLRSYLIHQLELTYGDTFLVSNIGFLIGVMFGIIWNFTVYSKIIWRKNKWKNIK